MITSQRFVITLIAVAVCWCFRGAVRATDTPAAAGELRVMSFNIRNSGAKDGADAWPKRKETFFKTIEAYDPDLLGVQEVLADQHDQLAERLTGLRPELSGVMTRRSGSFRGHARFTLRTHVTAFASRATRPSRRREAA